MEENDLVFEWIRSDSRYMEEIIKLANKNSSTLGFLPYEAFYKHAEKDHLIACIDNNKDKCAAYTLYTIGKGRVKLTHLCVDDEYRGRNIAKTLIAKIKNKTDHLQGILASCRRDYNLSSMWESLGFSAIHERPGKSRSGSTLTEWWLDYCNPNLITLVHDKLIEDKIVIAIDANVFFVLADEENRDEYSRDAQALLDDWLTSEIEIFVASEMNNEINRNDDPKKRNKLRNRLGKFNILSCPKEDLDKFSKEIRHLFPNNLSPSDSSDIRQIATSICSNIKIDFFVTKDTRLLEEVEEEIFEKYQLKIISPLELIINIDELRREIKYQPARLAGTSIRKKSVRGEDIETLMDCFLNNAKGEHKAHFRTILRQHLSDPTKNDCCWIEKDADQGPMVAYLINRESPEELRVPILRTKKNDLLASMCAQHLILNLINVSASENRIFTIISDIYLEEEIEVFLREIHFYRTERGWVKVNQKGCHTACEMAKILRSSSAGKDGNLRDYLNTLSNNLNLPGIQSSFDVIAGIEQAIFPGKITDSLIPNFMIPIKPWWAKDLFDEELAEQVIWGAHSILALRRELVYYRSKMASGGLKAPGRILWYVSQDKGFKKANVTLSAIRACSYIDEIIIDTPKSLYKKFKRLGIYEFDDLVAVSKGQDKELMAIRFSNTELFKNPISLKKAENLIGKNIHIQAPIQIDARSFELIYNAGVLC
ncbi:GNAT family N-acetyltransferase [Nodosilinea sp. E11]|uniref:GNAT family N-acetyltransferase n=1 Tax=Nodosilinea sp. E11 TaxID=3037479 RepID=UPI00293504E1|nr:GNAT family N-acetyltransferase [Nodosilinea sp. E11]